MRKSLSERMTTEDLWWKCNLEYVLSFFRKVAIVSDVFKVMGSSFQTLGAAKEKARLPNLSFVLGTISCEIDYLSCLGIFERCRRLAKQGGCCVDRAQY